MSQASIRFHVISLFPELIAGYLQEALLQKAIGKDLLSVSLTQLRDFSDNKYKSVDDTVYGGSDGMIFRPDLLEKALFSLEAYKSARSKKVVYLSPQGRKWNHEMAQEWASKKDSDIILISGRYGGIDQRFIDQYVDEEISIGDYVLSGGELAALTIIESTSRFIPGVLGHAASANQDSHQNGLLEAPQYTKPFEWNGRKVPEILLSGHHQNIKSWNEKISLLVTVLKSSELRQNFQFSEEQKKIFISLKKDLEQRSAWITEVFTDSDIQKILTTTIK